MGMRSKKLLLVILAILFALLQSTFLNSLQVFGVKPNILLILVIFASLYYGCAFGLAAGIFCGICHEATTALPGGSLIFAYAATAIILGRINRLIYNEGLLNSFLTTLAVALIVYLWLGLFVHIFYAYPPLFGSLMRVILPASFYTALLSPLMFRFLKIAFNY